jgi:hypothetical protein
LPTALQILFRSPVSVGACEHFFEQNEADQNVSAFCNAIDSLTKLVIFSVEIEIIAIVNFRYGIKGFCSH